MMDLDLQGNIAQGGYHLKPSSDEIIFAFQYR